MQQLLDKPDTEAIQLTDTERQLQAQFAKLEGQFAQLKDQTRQLQKLASLGTAAAMLAHEFNNLMTPVLSYAQHAVGTHDEELMIKALGLATRQIEITKSMSDRILGLAVEDEIVYEPLSLAQAVDDAVACLCRDLSKDGIILVNKVDKAVVAMADPRQMQQVLFNLLINARHAIKHRNGRITVTGEQDGDTVSLHLRDNGCGIEPENLDRIFEAFVTTKNDGPDGRKGSGLGLALCRDIIEDHDGSITVQSEVGKGTTFTITLPAAD